MEENNFEKQLFSITTIIRTECDTGEGIMSCTASGFYYTTRTPVEQDNKGYCWERIDGYWLITNRHVLFNEVEGKEYLVDRLIFCLRIVKDGGIEWMPIELTQKELINRTKRHQVDGIDVVAIDVSDCIHDRNIKALRTEENSLMVPLSLSKDNLPQNQPITIDVTSDIVVASYPKGFYDEVNKFPIVKSGIVASGWGLCFKGLPIFEIDAQLFPGSSGGLVISKPLNIAMINGSVQYSQTKQFVFLGVYSGEYQWRENVEKKDGSIEEIRGSYGLGNVWYSYLVPEIISDGVKIIV